MSTRKTTTAAYTAAEAAEIERGAFERGAKAFYALLRKIEALPAVLRRGYKREQDDSMRYNYEGAERAIYEFGRGPLSEPKDRADRVTIEHDENEFSKGFVRALVVYLTDHVNGIAGTKNPPLAELLDFDAPLAGGSDATNDDDEPTADDQTAREEIAWHAAGEIEAITNMLERETHQDGFDLILRTGLRRVRELNSIVLSVVGGDTSRETDEMCDVVYGWHAKEAVEANAAG